MLDEARRYAEELDIHHLKARCLLEEAKLTREGSNGMERAVRLVEDAIAIADKCEQPEFPAGSTPSSARPT
jgi:hypothetical protein